MRSQVKHRVRNALAACLACLAVLLAGVPASSQSTPTISCRGVQTETRCSINLVPAFDAEAIGKLKSGFVNRFLYRVYIRNASDDEPMALAAMRLVQVYELWDEMYYVFQNDRTGERTTSRSTTHVLELLGVFDDMTIAVGLPPGRYYADVIMEMNPLGEEDETAIRSWIARSRGADRTFTSGDRSFFGTFVSLFINIRPGTAERSFRARTPTFEVK